MQTAIDTFKLNLNGVRQLHVIYDFLLTSNVKALDLSEILRSEIVLTISALDTFISDVVYLGVLGIFEGSRSISPDSIRHFNEFTLDMETLVNVLNCTNISDRPLVLGKYLRKANSKNPYQDPKQIESVLLLLGVRQLWTRLSAELSMPPEDVKKELANIVWQRHKIAHEADLDQVTQQKRVRDGASTLKAIDFIDKLVAAIFNLVK